jgi:hypothetical protein
VSATRGKKGRSGGPDDVYPTPAWCVRRLLEAWQPAPGALFEAGAGDGAIIRAVTAAIGARPWFAVESRATCGPILRALPEVVRADLADFLTWSPTFTHGEMTAHGDVTAVIANAPFSLNEQFIRHARRCFPDAELAFLCRLNFLSSEDRFAFYAEMGGPDVYVLPNRPGFTTDGATDNSDYGWFVFRPYPHNRHGRLRHLQLTPPEERGKRARTKGSRKERSAHGSPVPALVGASPSDTTTTDRPPTDPAPGGEPGTGVDSR